MRDIERIVKTQLARVLRQPSDGGAPLNLEHDLFQCYGMTSLEMVLVMTGVCAEAAVPLTCLTEVDIAKLKTPQQIIDLVRAKGEIVGDATCHGMTSRT